MEEEGDPLGESIGARRTMATVSMERERERPRKDFRGTLEGRFHSISWKKKRKKENP